MRIITASALETVEDYIEDARILLQDVIAPQRYDDQSLLTSLNVTLMEARRLRPDLFVYNPDFDGVPGFNTVDTSPVDIEQPFRLALVYGLVSHALARDQEDVQDSRAATFMQTFVYMLTGKQPIPIQGGTPSAQKRE